ncbi:MAG: GIY-YIG nuclease family protein [Brevundimonas sp.]|uniref:GIY-YIG nuclease family protein n=1 Tax=Brevundimonas sp. TaxID=1871086 RepID=UPI00277392D1|nr:GIY-YIG nuclease family protein [Brevundimonas sp.]MDP3401041.1 GIY-YIG nuclease family protein [Brevundimonas sp.]MDZ4110431.1 GIY-YIG nuclease family protein [Brevundimonas sp.]
MSEGFVYILKNEAMPGYIKLGFTQQNDVEARMRQLHTTGVPLPFECTYFARVPDCRRVERALHFVFADDRAAASREFFRIDPDRAKAIVELVAIEVETLSDQQQQITPEQRHAIEEVKSRAEAMTFERLGLPIGTVLIFTKDPDVTCTIVGTREVDFRGEVMRLSSAALIAVREMGYSWSTVRGSDYWAFDGVKLSAMTPPESARVEGG